MPSRIERQQTRGWRKPPGAVYVGLPGKWGNPYEENSGFTTEERVRLFRRDLLAGFLLFSIEDVRSDLAGKDLMCWCKLGWPCHADVLLEVANSPRWGI